VDWPSMPPDEATIAAEMNRFHALSASRMRERTPDRDGRCGACGIWTGFRLVICHWLKPDVYVRVYEDGRAREWRERARRVMANELAPPGSPYDYCGLRVHMEAYQLEGACPLAQADYLAVALNVLPTRPCLLATGSRPASPRITAVLGEMEPPPLPSIDYRYLRLPARLDGSDQAATGRMLARALADMFERDDLPMVTMVGIGSPLSVHADAVRDHFEARGLLAPHPRRELDALVVLYTCGHPITHRKFRYRGVIVGTADHTCNMDEQWIAQMGVDDLYRGRYQPWYRILVDVRDRSPPQTCYVCHENILLWRDPPDEEEGGCGPIHHPDVRRAFTSYDKEARLYVAPHFT